MVAVSSPQQNQPWKFSEIKGQSDAPGFFSPRNLESRSRNFHNSMKNDKPTWKYCFPLVPAFYHALSVPLASICAIGRSISISISMFYTNIYRYIYIYGSPPPPGTYLFQFYTLFTVFKASPVKGFEGTGIPYSL